VHALNPFGFAWLRRVNEYNVDLNRNFQDFNKSLPSSAPYEAFHDCLVPKDWEGDERVNADAALQKFIAAKGEKGFQAELRKGNTRDQTTCFTEVARRVGQIGSCDKF
jgi:hypothetical protein